jgi:hypothetical protein
MRTYLYISSGIASALIGWSLGHVIISDLQWLENIPELGLFSCMAIFLAIGIVRYNKQYFGTGFITNSLIL